MRAMLLPSSSVNQTLPSTPAAIPNGRLPAGGTGNSVITPAVVMRPILLPEYSVNQTLPSGPGAIPLGTLPPLGSANSVMTGPEAVATPGSTHVAPTTRASLNDATSALFAKPKLNINAPVKCGGRSKP